MQVSEGIPGDRFDAVKRDSGYNRLRQVENYLNSFVEQNYSSPGIDLELLPFNNYPDYELGGGIDFPGILELEIDDETYYLGLLVFEDEFSGFTVFERNGNGEVTGVSLDGDGMSNEYLFKQPVEVSDDTILEENELEGEIEELFERLLGSRS